MSSKAARNSERDGFRFRGGHVALDLTATLAARAKASPRELLSEPDDLLRWLSEADLPCTTATPDDVRLAWRLREAIYCLLRDPPNDSDMERARGTLNEIAAMPSASLRLDSRRSVDRIGTATEMLAMIAREAILLIGGDARIRRCEGDGCSILFVDTSRRAGRRWCSMAHCGNRAKLADFRRRTGWSGGKSG